MEDKNTQIELTKKDVISEIEGKQSPVEEKLEDVKIQDGEIESNELKKYKRKKAILFMNLFCIIQIIYSSLAKIATNTGIHVMDLCFVRTLSLFGISIFTVYKSGKHIVRDTPKSDRLMVFARSIVGLISFTLYVYSLKVVSMFITMIIFNTIPFWTSILSYIFLREKVSKADIICMTGCFVGVIIIALAKRDNSQVQEISDDPQNDNFLVKQMKKTNEETAKVTNTEYIMGLFSIFGAAWCCAFVGVSIRYLKNLHFSLLVFHYGWIASFALMVWLVGEFVIYHDTFEHGMRLTTYSQYQWFLLLLIAISNALAMNLLTISFQNDKSTFVSILSYIMIVYAFIVDISVFQVSFGLSEMLGALLVLIFNFAAICIKMNEKPVNTTKVDQSDVKNDKELSKDLNAIQQIDDE